MGSYTLGNWNGNLSHSSLQDQPTPKEPTRDLFSLQSSMDMHLERMGILDDELNALGHGGREGRPTPSEDVPYSVNGDPSGPQRTPSNAASSSLDGRGELVQLEGKSEPQNNAPIERQATMPLMEEKLSVTTSTSLASNNKVAGSSNAILDASKASVKRTHSFIPLLDSPLHIASAKKARQTFSPRALNPSALDELPELPPSRPDAPEFSSSRLFEYTALSRAPRPPPPMSAAVDSSSAMVFKPSTPKRLTQPLPANIDTIDAISIHSADADGEDENDDVIVVHELMAFSPTKPEFPTEEDDSAPVAGEDSLFTPPLSDNDSASQPLFTPEPSPAPVHKQNSRRRIILSPSEAPSERPKKTVYVSVPRLSKPRSAYVKISTLVKQSKPVIGPTSVSVALQASWEHNLDVDHDEERPKKRRKKPRALEDTTPEPGPSNYESISVVRSKPTAKRQRPDDEPRRSAKRPRLTIDLTLSDDDDHGAVVSKKVKHKPMRNLADRSRLAIGVITPISIQALAFNTRFLRSKQADRDLSLNADFSSFKKPNPNINGVKKPLARRSCLVDRSNKSPDGEEEFSLGGRVPTSWDQGFRRPAEEQNDTDAVILDVESLPRGQSSPTCLPLPTTSLAENPPPKIDLAARMLEKKARKSIKDPHKLPATSSPLPPRSSFTVSQSSISVSLDDSEVNSPRHPSAKALGKRKAVYAPSGRSLSPSRPIYSTSQTTPSRLGLRVPDGNLDVFMHDFAPSPSLTHPSSSAHLRLDILGSTFPVSDSSTNGILGPHRGASSSPTALYRPDGFADNQETFFSESITEFETEPDQLDPWGVLEDPLASQYVFDTVDPTLLGGVPVILTVGGDLGSTCSASSEPRRSLFEPPSSRTPPMLSSSSSTSSSSTSSSRSRGAEQLSTATTTALDIIRPSKGRPLPIQRFHIDRKRQSSPIDGVEVLSRAHSEFLETSSSSSSSASDDSSEHSVIVSRPPRAAALKNPHISLSYVAPPKIGRPTVKQGGQDWPMDTNETYCHQCRRKTTLVKLSCPFESCNKVYCIRCVAIRYSDEARVFDFGTKGCPSCLSYCDCTLCSSKRGVKYESSRGKSCTSPAFLEKLCQIAGVDRPAAPPAPIALADVYWGTIYDLNGVRLGKTFVPSGPDASEAPAVVYLNTIPVNAKDRPRTHQIVYAGSTPSSCRHGNRKVKSRDLSPAPRPKKPPKGRALREFVGKSAPLFCRTKKMVIALEGLSPLTVLDEDWESDEVDAEILVEDEGGRRADEVEVFSEDSLSENDVARAIELGLNARGIQVRRLG